MSYITKEAGNGADRRENGTADRGDGEEVCGCNVNFILPDGTILAGTDPERVGEYHEIGHRAALAGKMLEVRQDNEAAGSRKGVNLPFSFRGEMAAVIGISGEPNVVRRYAYPAQGITCLILREKGLHARHRDERERVPLSCAR